MDVMGIVQLQENKLSIRECEVIELLALGYRNQEIATILGIKERTVRFHVGNIFEKLEVSNRTEATSYAFKKGWIND